MHSSKDPLHGVTLEALLNAPVARYGWAEMARQSTLTALKAIPALSPASNFSAGRRGRAKR